MRYLTLSELSLYALGLLFCMGAPAQDNPVDRALNTARQAEGTPNVAVEILQNDEHGDYDCHGRNARVMGNHNSLSFHNCGIVSVPGNQNTVNVYGAQTLKVWGTANFVNWAGETKPEITVLGSRNKVSQIPDEQPPREADANTGKLTGATIVIDQATPSSYEMNCEGRDVKIQAGNVSVVLHGKCGAIYVQGAMDQVQFDRAAQLKVTGTRNTIRWAQRPASISSTGVQNSLGPQ